MYDLICSFFATSFVLELAGFLFNLAYLYFIIRQKSVAWLWSILACSIFVWVCYTSQLYLQTGLYLFYILIAVYGLLKWKNRPSLVIRRMTMRHHVIFILVSFFLGFLLGFIFENHTNQHSPYLDGVITAFAVGTTLLIVSKHRENWLYWIVINMASMYLYYTQDLIWLTLMSLLLMLFAIRGFQVWSREDATN